MHIQGIKRFDVSPVSEQRNAYGAMREFVNYLSQVPRQYKRWGLTIIDALVLPVLLWSCYVLRLGNFHAEVMRGMAFWPLVCIMLGSTALTLCGIYRAVVRSFDEKLLGQLILAVLLVVLSLYVILFCTSMTIPMSIPLMFGFLMFIWVWSSRWLIRFSVRYTMQSHHLLKRVGIYGAGAAGRQLAAALRHSNEYLPVAFFDDKSSLIGHQIQGLQVISGKHFARLSQRLRLDEVLIAMPSAGRARRREVIRQLEQANVHVKVRELPGVRQLLNGEISVSDIRDVDIMDLLGRDPVPPDEHLLTKNLLGKVVMVTGAGGSIGSELCRQIVKNQPKKIILLELSEFALYSVEQELRRLTDVPIVPILGNVLQQKKMLAVMKQYRVQTVYHAAAYKHVPIVEEHPFEGLQNNAVGTARCARAAMDAGVETFVLVSTDKAVRPTNVMGASKRMAELVCQGLAAQPGVRTQFSIVRFGNVLGSSGSVVPLFRQQIASGNAITVTHPEVTRYFMTIPEAAQLVIQAGAMGRGGDVFVLDMGEPIRIQDLARQMIFLSGLQVKDEQNPFGDIEIRYTGLRPGEKLYEELLIDGDNIQATDHPRIMHAFEKSYPLAEVDVLLDRLITMADEHDMSSLDWVIDQLEYFVDGYRRSVPALARAG